MTEKQAQRNARADFTFLVSWWAPNADAEALRTLVDWQHWAFPWDDQFDEGHLKNDLVKAAEDIIHMTSILDDSHPPIPENSPFPIRYAFQQNWFRIRQVCRLASSPHCITVLNPTFVPSFYQNEGLFLLLF